MRFEWPIALVALLLIPLALLAYVLVERRRARYAIRFTNLDVLASVLPKSGTAQKRRFIPPLVFALAVAVALIGIARPAVARNVPREQATVILVIDTSGSMVANDVAPSRLSAAQDAVRKFIGKLPGRFRVGMVTFSSQARVAMPITDDRDLAKQGLENLNAFGGTAIGDAIGRSLSPPPGVGPGGRGERRSRRDRRRRPRRSSCSPTAPRIAVACSRSRRRSRPSA